MKLFNKLVSKHKQNLNSDVSLRSIDTSSIVIRKRQKSIKRKVKLLSVKKLFNETEMQRIDDYFIKRKSTVGTINEKITTPKTQTQTPTTIPTTPTTPTNNNKCTPTRNSNTKMPLIFTDILSGDSNKKLKYLRKRYSSYTITKNSNSGSLEPKMKFEFNRNIKSSNTTTDAIKNFVDMSHPAEFIMRTKMHTPVAVTTSIDKFITPLSYDSQSSDRTVLRKRQPAMGVSAYSLRVKKNMLNNSQISNEYVKRIRTNSNHSTNVSNVRSNSCAYYSTDDDQMYLEQELIHANNGTTPINHTNQANLITISLLKNRRIQSVNALYEQNPDMYSTDV